MYASIPPNHIIFNLKKFIKDLFSTIWEVWPWIDKHPYFNPNSFLLGFKSSGVRRWNEHDCLPKHKKRKSLLSHLIRNLVWILTCLWFFVLSPQCWEWCWVWTACLFHHRKFRNLRSDSVIITNLLSFLVKDRVSALEVRNKYSWILLLLYFQGAECFSIWDRFWDLDNVVKLFLLSVLQTMVTDIPVITMSKSYWVFIIC